MIQLRENEQILLTLHKHWVVIFSRLISIIMLGILPFLVFLFAERISTIINPAFLYSFILFVAAIWWLGLLLILFIEWIDYWLDAWIASSPR